MMDILSDHFRELTTSPKNVEQLKQLVLQLAVQGKLTGEWRDKNMDKISKKFYPSEIISENKVRKEILISKKELKRERTQSPSQENLFKIPDSWKWTKLIDITKQITDGTHQTPKYTSSGGVFLSAQNVKPFRFMPENHKFVSDNDFQTFRNNKIPEKGDLLVARVGAGIGEAAIIDKEIEFAFYVSLGLVKFFHDIVNSKYIALVFNSPFGVSYSKGNISSKGGSAGNFNLGRIRTFQIPFPPLPEQKAIVEKVESLFAKIDRLHQLAQKKAETRQNAAKAIFGRINNAATEDDFQTSWQLLHNNFAQVSQTAEGVKELRQSILQLAVQGRLTANWRKQNPDVEPASVLLERIQDEKKRLIKEKKIRRQKPLPEITDAEKPFELPEGWAWCRLGSISNYGQSDKIEPKNITDSHTWVLELEDIEKNTSKLLKKVTLEERNPKSTKSIFKPGNILYGKLRPYLDKVIVAEDTGICTTEIIPIQLIGKLNPYFIRFTLKRSDFLNYVETQVSGMRMPRLKTEGGRNALIPIPPLPEQKAIVEKVNRLMSWCDELENKAKEREALHEKTMQAVVQQFR